MWEIYIPLLLLGTYVAYNRFFHPLAKVPGPFLASICPLWIAWQASFERRPRLDLELHRRYGSVVRISPNEIIFSNPDYFKAVYGAGTRFTKGRFYEATATGDQPPGWEKLDLLPEMDIEKLRVQKRLAGPVYSAANVKNHEAYIDNCIRRFVDRLRSRVDRPVDIYREFELVNIDVMTEITFGQPFGAVESGGDGGHMASMEKMWRWWGWIGYLPALNLLDKTLMPWFLQFSPTSNHLPVFPWGGGKMAEYQQRVDADEPLAPCLHHDLRQLTRSRPEFKYNWGTRLSLTNFGAGIDTTSWSLSAMVAEIGQNAAVAARLCTELDALRSGAVDVPYDAAVSLQYLQACMHEAMRLWPNIAISLPRIVPKGGIVIDGFHIPEGYTVGMNSRQLALAEKVFGPEPQAFRPERWLEADRARRNDMETRNLTFGGPSRKCPGMHLAWVSMLKILTTLLLNFDVKVLNEIDGKPGPGGHVWLEKGSFPTKWHGLEVELRLR